MFQFQTLACLHDIPVVRSSTDIIQQTYTKAKDSSAVIRVPCSVAEYVADKSLKIAATITSPFVKPIRGHVEVIDNYAAKKIRVIESKYPVITTSTDDVVNTFNARTETVRNVVSSVKKSTTDTIQHGKETISNVASATVTKATGVADSVYAFYEAHAPRTKTGKYFNIKQFTGCLTSKSTRIANGIFSSIQKSFNWCRIVMFYFLLRIKEINDNFLTKFGKTTKPLAIIQRIFVEFSVFLERLAGRIQPDDRSMDSFNRTGRLARIYPSRDLVTKPTKIREAFSRELNGSESSATNGYDLDDLHQQLGGKTNSFETSEPNYDNFDHENTQEKSNNKEMTQHDSDDD